MGRGLHRFNKGVVCCGLPSFALGLELGAEDSDILDGFVLGVLEALLAFSLDGH